MSRICIVGLGLMGGSLAWALRPHVSALVGVDRDEETVAAALAAGVIDAGTTDFAAGVQSADLVVLATPVRAILHLLADLPRARPEGCQALDLGSTKGTICAAMDELPPAFAAIGGHPMCGKETAGFAAAMPDLVRGQAFVLCETARTTGAMAETAAQVVTWIGARALPMAAAAHDGVVAVTSHLPYLAAAALMRQAAAAAMVERRVWPVSASGLRDTTRIAGTNPDVMLDILLTNRAAVLQQLRGFQARLVQLEDLLRRGDEAALRAWLVQAQVAHQSYQQAKASPFLDQEPTDGFERG